MLPLPLPRIVQAPSPQLLVVTVAPVVDVVGFRTVPVAYALLAVANKHSDASSPPTIDSLATIASLLGILPPDST